MRLGGKVAIVTGAGRGIGRGIAVKLAQEGAKVVVCDMVAENGEGTVRAIAEQGGEAWFQGCNVADDKDVSALFRAVMERYSAIDIVVNNAGINRDGMLHKLTLEQWDQVIRVNLTGTFHCVQEAAKIMRNQNFGRIINIASASWLGNIGQANYAASKAGVVGLTKTAARELAKYNVTVNAICPGFIDTDMTRGVPEKVWDVMVGKIPMGRAGQPEDVANVIAFLASDEAGYVTAEVINVGGGMVL
ncbi:3-oxoacyl-ACP reductase FabG [Alicyclobacillus fastidiosus]|uniref:3-oxoacyl-ACP reductase FabG n=1 Tax=Alicyclobacillus fastidiosus TaxID=392011 RepID=A0ABY6ZE99_9BACL|nr:3-oxoacyl-ACP reductase FabG [Alicyclobacillus fastidiosus]WAH40566.1 3-oxoacyl-ACP reductase FabG [Alicyclobacillus fastidiosus]GMA62001.1 beta-ketoacyl-ACP reductase [Alicyclobacillus fastidiosus]